MSAFRAVRDDIARMVPALLDERVERNAPKI
jgi:hypothetical protein